MQITTMPQVLSAEHSAIIKQTVGIKCCTHHDGKRTAGTNLTNTLLIMSTWLVLSTLKRVWSIGTKGYWILHTENLEQALGMLHPSARALCASQTLNIAWARSAKQLLLWLLVMCCAINMKCAKAPPSQCIANTKQTQTPGPPGLTTESWAHCNLFQHYPQSTAPPKQP